MEQDTFITFRVSKLLKSYIDYIASKNGVATSYLLRQIITFLVEDVIVYNKTHDRYFEGYLQNLEERIYKMRQSNQ